MTARSEITRLLLGSALVDDDVAKRLVMNFESSMFDTRKARAVFDTIRAFVSDGLSPGERMASFLGSTRVVDAGVTCADLATLVYESCPPVASAYITERLRKVAKHA